MRITKIIFAVVFLFSAAQAFAHDDEGKSGPCSSYFATCKSDPSVTGAKGKAKWKAMHECVTAAAKADTANGQACLDAQAKHHDHGHKHGGNESATPTEGN